MSATPTAAPSDFSSVRTDAARPRPVRWWHWWPFLLAPLAITLCALSHLNDSELWMQKPVQEPIALMLTSYALIFALLKLGLHRNRFYLLFALLAASIVLRELHFEWTTKFIYGAVAALAVLTFVWRATVVPFFNANPHRRCWLIATAWTYVFSQIIARKGLQHLVPEASAAEALFDGIYTDTEEVVENIAHLMLLITALIGAFRPLPQPIAATT